MRLPSAPRNDRFAQAEAGRRLRQLMAKVQALATKCTVALTLRAHANQAGGAEGGDEAGGALLRRARSVGDTAWHLQCRGEWLGAQSASEMLGDRSLTRWKTS